MRLNVSSHWKRSRSLQCWYSISCLYRSSRSWLWPCGRRLRSCDASHETTATAARAATAATASAATHFTRRPRAERRRSNYPLVLAPGYPP